MWLKRMIADCRGNVLAITAATMPLVLCGAAMAIDTIQLSVWKRQLQRAADSGAVAGAYALAQTADVTDAVHHDLEENEFPVLSQPETITVGPSLGFNRTVRVQLTAQRTVPFMSFFTGGSTIINTEATAALTEDGEFCMVSLYDGTSAGIDVGGTADVTLGCGMMTNSRAASAVTATGDSTVTATPISARGGLNGSSNNFVGTTTLIPYAAPMGDPLGNIANPTIPGGTPCSDSLAVQPGDTVTPTATGGVLCYTSMDIKGTVTFPANTTIYINGGDVDFGSQANVTGNGVTFVMTGPNGQAGDLKMNGQAHLDLSPPATGEYYGVLFYRDRRAPSIEIKINGGSDMSLKGALYFPTSDITFTGGAGMEVECLQMIGQILLFRGNAAIANSCPDSTGYRTIRRTIVRLVG